MQNKIKIKADIKKHWRVSKRVDQINKWKLKWIYGISKNELNK